MINYNNKFKNLLSINWALLKKFLMLFIFFIALSFFLSYLIKPNIHDFLNLADRHNKLEITSDSLTKFVQYSINNGLKVPFQMLLLSLIPLPFLYFFPVILTAIMTGIVLYIPFMSELAGKVSFSNILLGLLPHIIIEVFGFLIVACGAYYINQSIRSKLFKKIPIQMTFIASINHFLLTYCLVALPSFIIAAFIEAFITPLFS